MLAGWLPVVTAVAEPAPSPRAAEEPQPVAPPRIVAAAPNTEVEAVHSTDRPAALSAKELAAGWLRLFDGHSLFGWQAGSDVDWRVVDGAITATAGERGLLYTSSVFADYELDLEFRAEPGTNSGVFLRTPPVPTDPRRDCYELNIAPEDNPFPTGSFVGRQRVQSSVDDGRWHRFQVRAEGGRFQVRLDGREVLDYTDPAPLARGHIGLQFNEGRIAFRDVKLRPLGLAPIFNGRDLTGWRIYPDKTAEFSVTPEGELKVVNGNGQLESEGQWADFVLDLEILVDGPHLNSGIFFRSIPGEFWQGYESQIHNGYHDGDRTRPIDCGTGGFYRRQDARRVVADDHKWFRMTLVVAGPQMATWIDGYQVSDWTDTRAADENPRRGLRLAAGTLSIQAHDPTTNLRFRRIRLAAFPPAETE